MGSALPVGQKNSREVDDLLYAKMDSLTEVREWMERSSYGVA